MAKNERQWVTINLNETKTQISDTEDQREVEEEDFVDAFEVQESPKKVESKRNKWTINLTSLKELETLLEEESPTFSRPLQFPEINIKNIYSDVEGMNNSVNTYKNKKKIFFFNESIKSSWLNK